VETARLFCLPYAGGDEFAYWRWADLLAGVHAIRRDGPPSVDRVADRIAAGRGPFAIYGHSMGARLGFEVVRELRRRGAPLPERLYVGGAHPPDDPEPIARVAHLDIGEFIDQLVTRADTPAAVRDDPDIRAAVEPALAADLAWLQAYRFRPEPPLPVPIVAFAATDDREVPRDLMLGWARHTSAWFRHHTLAAGHLFVGTHAADVTVLISQSGDTGAAPPGYDEVHLWRVETAPVDKAERLVLERYPDGIAGSRVVATAGGGTALVAVGPSVHAVAVERMRSIDDLDAFCAGLDPDERAAVLGEPEEDRVRAALRARTAHEVRAAGAVRRLDLGGAVAAIATAGDAVSVRIRYETTTGDAR
jgi:surfactin synthase thioesterase subunit